MCGIVGYSGNGNIKDCLIDGLKRLEYRGYDSAGIATVASGRIITYKSVGRVHSLEEKLPELNATCGIGHTRWATNGVVCQANCHPILSRNKKFAVVHNGIIENAYELRLQLESNGYTFSSDTDTECIANLLESHYDGDMLETLRKLRKLLVGSYAIAVLIDDSPYSIFVAKYKSPLAVGITNEQAFVASDINALPIFCDKYVLEDNQVLEVKAGCEIYSTIAHDGGYETVCKDGYAHYMLKEIYEQPTALERTLLSPVPDVERTNELEIIACGSSYNAGICAKPFFEMRGIRCDVSYASEYRYSPPRGNNGLAVLVSQSGETADTIAAQQEAVRRGKHTLGIVNTKGSALSRDCEHIMHTVAGSEIAVATTKGFTTQLLALYRLALMLSGNDDSMLTQLPKCTTAVMQNLPLVQDIANIMRDASNVYFIGRGADYGVAKEGALKLKEISYIHAEAYPAGEIKHGAISLITDGTPVIVISTNPSMYSKTMLSLNAIKSRGGKIIAITSDEITAQSANYSLMLPKCDYELAPCLAVVLLQLLAYYTALNRACDIDKPRNLAKSVTVE